MSQLSDIFKKFRGDRRQFEIAEAAGIKERAYSNYENGVREPEFELVIKIAKALGCEKEIASLIIEQNVPRETQTELSLVPGKAATIDQLSDRLKQLKVAAAEIEKIITNKISSAEFAQVLPPFRQKGTGEKNLGEQKVTFSDIVEMSSSSSEKVPESEVTKDI